MHENDTVWVPTPHSTEHFDDLGDHLKQMNDQLEFTLRMHEINTKITYSKTQCRLHGRLSIILVGFGVGQ